LGPEDADAEKTLDADEDLDETLPYSLPYEDNDKDKDNNNIGYRVQWEPLNGSLVETVEDGGELCTHKFNTDEEPAPFSTSFVEDEEGEEEAPDSLQPVAPDAETQQVVETPIITRATVTGGKRATFSIQPSGRFWRQGLVGLQLGANAKSFGHEKEIDHVKNWRQIGKGKFQNQRVLGRRKDDHVTISGRKWKSQN